MASENKQQDLEYLLQLQPVVSLTTDWFSSNIPKVGRVTKYRIDPSRVIWGRMATVLFVELIHIPEGSVDNSTDSTTVLVKRVVPSELALGDVNLSPFIESAQAEMEYYKQYSTSENFPTVYGSFERNAKGENEGAGFLMCMEDLSDHYHQTRSVSDDRSIARALTGLAELTTYHAFKAYQQASGRIDPELSTVALRQACFWPLNRRPDTEVVEGEAHWSKFLEMFGDLIATHLKHPEGKQKNIKVDPQAEFKTIGSQLRLLSNGLDRFTKKQMCSIVHGDAKNWNLFHPNEEVEGAGNAHCKIIDLQWTGIGHPLQDFLYFMTTSVDSDVLVTKWDEWLEYFREKLTQQVKHVEKEIKEFEKNDFASWKALVLSSSLVDFKQVCDILWLDYARVVCFGLWKRLTPEKQIVNAKKVGISLVTGSMDQMCFILQRIVQVLDARADELKLLLDDNPSN